MIKRVLSFILLILLLITSIPLNVFSAETSTENTNDTVISVNQGYGKAETVVKVDIFVDNNPGFVSLDLRLYFDSSILTLLAVENGSALANMNFVPPIDDALTSGCALSWDAEKVDEELVVDGVVATLTFQINKGVEANSISEVSVQRIDAKDNDLRDLFFSTLSGKVQVLTYTPGDVNDDGIISATDNVYIRRFNAGGYGVVINEAAADVNDDGMITSTDVVYIRRYMAGGYFDPDTGKPLMLKPSTPKCAHNMTATAAKAATCTDDGNIAYWYCELCQKYFEDEAGTTEVELANTIINALGHNIVTVPGYDATKERPGLTDGKACNRAGCYYVEVEQVEIPIVTGYVIKYEIANGEDYIEKNTPIIPADKRQYFSDTGIELPQPQVAGYRFIGWSLSQASSDNIITEIPAGTTGDKTLYGHWQPIEYTITFDSPDIPFEKKTYTVDSGATLTNPSWFGYTFVGWSDDNGFIVNRIKPGTTGNITLHANWTSDRNKATSYQSYGAPIIIEDDKNGQILFVYNIGKIDNVPLNEVEFIGKTETLNYKKEVAVTDTVDETYVDNINKMISEATTKSSGWTLSNEWEDIYSSQEQVGNLSEKSDERTTADGKVVGGKYFVSNSEGGSTYVSTESGGSTSSSSKVTTENSVGINASYDHTTEKYCDAKLGASNVTETNAGIELPIKIAKVSAGVKNTTTVEAEVKNGRKDNDAFHIDGSISGYVGTVDFGESSSYYNSVVNDSSSWNSTNSYEQSSETSREESVTNAIKEQISQTTTHNLSKALGQTNSNTTTKQDQHMSSEEYSTSFTYNKGSQSTVTKLLEFNSSEAGYYRIITAGTVHVYGVVGYDVATASYYTYCFNVLDDTTREILDYSKDNMNFNDCENGVVTFDIPYEINEYVAGFVGKTDGLEISYDGVVTDFEAGENFGGTVVVPQYEAKNNLDGTFSAVKVTSFDASAFAGKENIETVVLPIYITNIPDGAFAGCTNLKTVIAYGVTSIGANAFSGCENLNKFYVDNAITSLGAKAFEGVPEVAVTAYNAAVADAAISCGAKKISVNVSYIKDTYENKVITVDSDTLYFALIGNGGNYNNVRIDSAAKETLISNMVFANNSDTPLKLASEKVTLARVKVENSPSFALVLTADNSELALLGTVSLNSAVENTVLSKNVTLKTADHNTTSKLVLNGRYLVYGSVTNTSYLNVTPTAITEGAYNGYLLPSVVTFNANGGSVGQNSKVVYKEHTYGTLPTPEKQYFAFKGWYTAAEGGTLITADTKVNTDKDHTLYAHWEAVTATIKFNANGGAVDQTSKVVYIGQAIGELPKATMSGYIFDGWYTALSGGSKVTASTVMGENDIVVYARWTKIVATSATIKTPATKTVYNQGDTFSAVGLTLTVKYNDGTSKTVTYTDCTISSPNMTSAGTKTVTATYEGVSVSYSVTVKALTLSLSVDTTSASSGIINLKATASAGTVTWKSSNTSVATVDSTGKVTLKDCAGTATITATAKNGACTAVATKEITVSNTSGTKYKETSSADTATVLYATRPEGYNTALPVTGTIPTYSVNSADITGSTKETTSGRVEVAFANSGIDGYVYYQFNYNSSDSSGKDNENKIIHWKEDWRLVQSSSNNFKFHTSFGRQFYSKDDYREHTAQQNWTPYYAIWWAYQDKQAGHTWYVALGIEGALAGSWYRFPVYNYTKTVTTYTYWYYSVK